jgi:TPR repeat protein
LLQRVAEGGHAQAALALAGTYDPAVLRKLSVYGIPGDEAKAREWYERARDLGSKDASAQLEALARAR